MKLNSTPPMSNAPARRFTRANQAWAVDHAVLDFPQRIFVRLVTDVSTRRPLSATLTFGIADIGTGLERLADRSGRPEQIWLDNYYKSRSDPALKSWTEQHRISIIYVPMQMPQMKSLSERLHRDLSAFLHGKRFPTLMELGHDIERWRQRYCAAAQPIPDVKQ
jgi:hypothetical protein